MRSKILLSLLFTLLAIGPVAAGETPDLVVVISIDQFPYEYIQRFAPYFGDGGFNRFLRNGADFPNARYDYAATFTGPGHASIGTGLVPAQNGIVANDWYDRVLSERDYCAGDERALPTSGASDGASPNNLASDSLGDRVREKYRNSKVIGVSIKDRAAILMAGRKANAAYWFDYTQPAFVSSSYYRANPKVLEFNSQVKEFVATHDRWTQSSFIPTDALRKLTFDSPELRKFKGDRSGLGVTFPHPIGSANALTYTPFGNDLVLLFARHIVAVEELGTAGDGSPDVLFVSLSSPDYLGHLYGPDSLEVADNVVRLDRSLASFIDWIEKNVTKNLTVAITSDHGVQQIPEVAIAQGKSGGRFDLCIQNDDKTFADFTEERGALERTAAKKLRIRYNPKAIASESLVLSIDEPSIYLNWNRIRALGLDGEKVRRAFRDAARDLPGVSSAFTNSELMMSSPLATGIEKAVRRSFRPDRSGDVLVTLAAGWIWTCGNTTGTTHGQPVEADQHVPVMLWGTGIKPKVYSQSVAPTDLARALGVLLGVDVGQKNGLVLPAIERPQ